MPNSLSRRRAAFVFQRLRRPSDKHEKQELARDLKGRPIQVRNLGLSTVLAMTMNDKKKESVAGTVRTLIVEWLAHERCPTRFLLDLDPERQNLSIDELLAWCLEADNASYRAVQAEVIALLDQAKVLAAALDAAEEWQRHERMGTTDG